MTEAEALLLVHSLRNNSEPETALEQGWLLAEMEAHLGYTIEELARRFNRSGSWVARRLSLVETLPETVQQQVRDGRITAQIAMRYLAPVARNRRGTLPAYGADLHRTTLDHAAIRTALQRLA